MSDSFADLWNSTAPSKPAAGPQKLGSLASNTTINTTTQRRPQYDAFSLLSSTGTSTQSSRSTTPGMAAAASGRISQASQSSLGAQLPRPTSTASSSSQKPAFGGDAFSDLLGTSNKINDKANMTIAERAKLAERQKLGQQQPQPKTTVDATWNGLDSLMVSGGGVKPKAVAKPDQKKVADDWDLLSTTTPAKPTTATTALDDDWGLSPEFGGAPSVTHPQPSSKPKTSTQSKSLWELDEFNSDVTSDVPDSSTALNDDFGFGNAPSTNSRSRTDSPSNDFDFGSREDGLLQDADHDDDILGELSAPAHQPRALESRPSQQQQRNTSRTSSPPPHVIGQLVEMGFSVQQAKIALATTDSGVDVEAALEILISNGVADNEDRPQIARDSNAGERHKQGNERPRGQQRQQNREARAERGEDQRTPELNLQEQADKIREIGMNMFNKASLFWKEGKERVQRVVEERVGPVAEAGKARSGAFSRPKWMQDAVEDEENGRAEEVGAFRDADDYREESESKRTAVQPEQRRQQPQQQPSAPSSRSKVADPFDTAEEPVVYKSRFRYKAPQASTSATPSHTPPVAIGTPFRSPTPLKRRAVVSCSPSVLSQSESHKAVGAEKYKLGQYGAAEESYTSAIACLPSNHLMLVPLHNNRALVRMKNGNYLGAAEDASVVITIIGEDYHPLREAKVEGRKEDGAGIDLTDGFVKALKRRAEAWEGRERWSDAGRDWEKLAGIDWAEQSVKTEAVRGAGRCRRMVDAATKPPAAAPAKPKARPAPRPSAALQGESKAVSALRETTSLAEAEDAAKHQLKDSVDSRLQAWKGGKETNIRALLSSLDTVLWAELGLQKISLAELMSAGQVKKWYMKAIAKVHPDKLNSSNSTLEQRMLAGGVFAALNEAWIAFKP